MNDTLMAKSIMLPSVDGAVINDAVIGAIVAKMVEVMGNRIAKIEPSDCATAEYGDYWTYAECDGDDWITADVQNERYSISFNYELSWECREWTEDWDDPFCHQSFCETRNEGGRVFGIEISIPDGDVVKSSICETIADRVNDIIQ